MRTSTGSISVMKIIQKKTIRSRKRKYTTAKAASSEMLIFPKVMPSAMIRLFSIIVPTVAPTSRGPTVRARR
jgi:hypothetical protein